MGLAAKECNELTGLWVQSFSHVAQRVQNSKNIITLFNQERCDGINGVEALDMDNAS